MSNATTLRNLGEDGEWSHGRGGEWSHGRGGEWSHGRGGEWSHGRDGERETIHRIHVNMGYLTAPHESMKLIKSIAD